MSVGTDGFVTVDVSLVPQGTVADPEVAKSGIKINTVPEGKYTCNIVHLVVEQLRPDDMYNPNRHVAKTRFRTESGKLIFADLSWEPPTNPDGYDLMGKLYSNVEQALGMYGGDVTDVLQTAAESTFVLELTETVRAEVGELPEELAATFLEKGKGELDKVTVYLKEDQDDLRQELAINGLKLKNGIKSITLA